MTTKKSKDASGKFFNELLGEASLAKTLEAIRLADDIALTEFAKKLGISKQTLCDVEKGRTLVSPERAKRFAKKLGYSEKVFVKLAVQDLLAKSGMKYRVELEAA